jgi:hypothetical protein
MYKTAICLNNCSFFKGLKLKKCIWCFGNCFLISSFVIHSTKIINVWGNPTLIFLHFNWSFAQLNCILTWFVPDIVIFCEPTHSGLIITILAFIVIKLIVIQVLHLLNESAFNRFLGHCFPSMLRDLSYFLSFHQVLSWKIQLIFIFVFKVIL